MNTLSILFMLFPWVVLLLMILISIRLKFEIANILGIASLFLGLLGVFSGPIPYPCSCIWLVTFHKSIGPELVGIGITVLLIDWANDQRALTGLKSQLIREMSSRDSGISERAAQEMLAHGWGYGSDKSLNEARLGMANLDGAYLPSINLQNAFLRKTKLRGTNLQDANLRNAYLVQADLTEANLFGAHLEGADLWDADLNGARLVSGDQPYFNAHLNSETILPDDSRWIKELAPLKFAPYLALLRFVTPSEYWAEIPPFDEDAPLYWAVDSERDNSIEQTKVKNLATSTPLIKALRSKDRTVVIDAWTELRNLNMAYDGTLAWVNLRYANLQDLNLSWAKFKGADLRGANLCGVDLSGADLRAAILFNADLVGAKFHDPYLGGIAAFDKNTILPDGQPWSSAVDLTQFTSPSIGGSSSESQST